jgi:hypothetical protein
MFLVVVIHEQGNFWVNFYGGTWEGGWGIMSMQGGGAITTYNKVV